MFNDSLYRLQAKGLRLFDELRPFIVVRFFHKGSCMHGIGTFRNCHEIT